MTMRRVCVWCGRVWEASRIDPPEDQPYFCPRCEDKRLVLRNLTGGEADEDTREEEKPPTALQRCGRLRHTEVRHLTNVI